MVEIGLFFIENDQNRAILDMSLKFEYLELKWKK